jgi:ABC-type uncharacterized transport system ATPase component
MDVSINALVTARTLNSSLISVLSTILGSVAGVLSITTGSLTLCEKIINKIKEITKSKRKNTIFYKDKKIFRVKTRAKCHLRANKIIKKRKNLKIQNWVE